MNLRKLLTRNQDEIHKSHIRNLIEVALSDGSIDEEEMVLLLNLAQKIGISKEDIDQIRQHPVDVTFQIPKNSMDRFNQIHDLVCMMMVDGVINRKELKLCKDLALKLGYLPRIVDDFILMISRNISAGVSSEESYKMMKKIVN